MDKTNTKDLYRLLLRESMEADLPPLVPRDVDTQPFEGHSIISVIGPRRAGKTSLCHQVMRDLISSGIPRQQLFFIDFEDERLHPLRGGELTVLWDLFLETFPPDGRHPVWCFLDEVQNVPFWSKWVRRVTTQRRDVRVVVTGSSSKLLSTEIASELRGRGRSVTVYPYSFREFLRAHGLDVKDAPSLLEGSRRHEVARLLSDFAQRGGFPGVLHLPDYRETLQEYYHTMFSRDIMERFRVSNSKLFEDFLKIQVTRFSTRSSISNLAEDMKAIGHRCGKATLVSYLKYAREVFLLFEVPLFSPKVKNQLLYPRKIYGIDHGLLNAIRFSTSEDRGRILENMVHMELKRRGHELFYFAGKGECDFILRQEGRTLAAIQVCYSLEGRETRDRERRGLLEAMQTFNLKEGMIVTRDESEEWREDGREFRAVPFARFALTWPEFPRR